MAGGNGSNGTNGDRGASGRRRSVRGRFEKRHISDHVPTQQLRDQVEVMASMGLPMEYIAPIVGIKTDMTLRKHYHEELKRGWSTGNLELVTTAHKVAVGGNVAMLIWLTKVRLGWRDQDQFVAPALAGDPADNVEDVTPEEEARTARILSIVERVKGRNVSAEIDDSEEVEQAE